MQKKEQFIDHIKENEGIIYKVSRIYTNNVEDQKDLFQEIMYQLWKSFPSFKGGSKVSTWMYRVALNTAITYFKKVKRNDNKVPIDTILLQKVEQIDASMDERLTLLYKHIQDLNVIEKGIILLYLEGNNYDEIGEITGFTSTNIGTRLHRIKNKLKKQMNT